MIKIEKIPLENSPLLGQAVSKKNYLEDLAKELDNKKPENPIDDTPIDSDTNKQDISSYELPPTPGEEQPEKMSFEDDLADIIAEDDTPSIDDTDIPDKKKYRIPKMSTEKFAKSAVKLYKLYIPKWSYDICKLDINNARLYVDKGILDGRFINTFQKCNENTYNELQEDPEALELLQEVLQEYLQSEQVSFANPKTAFWGVLGFMMANKLWTGYNLFRENKKLIDNTLRLTNPDLFKSTEADSVEEDVKEKFIKAQAIVRNVEDDNKDNKDKKGNTDKKL